jgi:glycosyltransferase involved in cell wall biosynthesis
MPKLEKTEYGQSAKRPLRVLFLTEALDGGGAEKVLVELLEDLDRSRIQPSLFLLRHRGIYLNKVPPDVSFTWGVEDGQLIRDHACGFLSRLWAAAASSDVVVGAVELMPSYFAWFAAALARKPLVGWVHQDLHLYIQHRPLWDRKLASVLYPRFSAAVVLTEAAIRSLHNCTGMQTANIRVIPNYVNTGVVRELAAEATPFWTDALIAKPFIMGLGRLVNRDKGWDVLLRAHALVRSQGIDHNFVIVGEGSDRNELEGLARELNVQDSFFLPGFDRNPFPVLKSALALVAGARLEGFGLALVEAMALGVPVIASDSSSGPVTILEGGKYGLLVSADDVDGFADAIRDLLSCPAKREDYSRRATKRAEYYNVKTAKQWETVLRSVAQLELTRHERRTRD